jgi:HK97 gp10 family phage protein
MFTAKIEGADKVLLALQNIGKEKIALVDDRLKIGANEIAARAKQLAPTDESFLKQGISAKSVSRLEYEVVSQRKYAAYMEFGTKKKAKIPAGLESVAQKYQGKGGGTFQELLKSITEWVRRKGISGTYSVKTKRRTGRKADRMIEDLEVAYPIAWSIAKHGVKPHPSFFPAFNEIKPQIVKDIKDIVMGEYD